MGLWGNSINILRGTEPCTAEDESLSMLQPLEGLTDSYIIKEVELKEVLGLARYLRRVNLCIRSQLIEFEDIFDYSGDRIVSAGFKLKFDDLREAVRKGLKEVVQSHPEINGETSAHQKRKAQTQIDEPTSKRIKWE